MTNYGDDIGIGPVDPAPTVSLGDQAPHSWGLDDIREEKDLLEPAKDVQLLIKKATVQCVKDGSERQWKWIDINFVVVRGYDVGGEVKYKGKYLFERICFYANHAFYAIKETAKIEASKRSYDKQIAASQHLVDLKAFINAACPSIKNQIRGDFQGITNESAQLVCEAAEGQTIVGSITQNKDATENTVKYYKAVPRDQMV